MPAAARAQVSTAFQDTGWLAAEEYVLGALILDSRLVWPLISERVTPDCFERPDHKLIFAAIGQLIKAGAEAEVLALESILTDRGQLQQVGGLAYLGKLASDTAGTGNVAFHAERLIQAAHARALRRLGEQIDKGLAEGASADQVAEALIPVLEQFRLHTGPQKEDARRQALDWAALESIDPPQRLWRLEHWLSTGPTLLAGRGGIGKTLLAQTLATALALGRPYLGAIDSTSTVLFWACEDDHDELWRRQLAINKFFGIKLSDLCGKLILEPRLGRENTLLATSYGAPSWTPLMTELRTQCQDYGAEVVFLDNIGQLFGAKESDRHAVTQFVNGIAGLVLDRPFTSVIMGHPAKQEESEFSGSTAWENAVRMRWYMGQKLPDQPEDEGAEEDESVRYLAKRKANYTVKDFRKLVYRDGVFVSEQQQGEFTRRFAFGDRQQGATECVLHALERFATAGIRATDGRTSPDFLPKLMRGHRLTEDFTPRELTEALGKLRLAGRLTEGPVGQRFANRQQKFGLKVAS